MKPLTADKPGNQAGDSTDGSAGERTVRRTFPTRNSRQGGFDETARGG
ncbi:hypothetical protein P4E94_00170 [Pontiellaceae bacterium B12219]|nr:hypothetical protein [Pontiellaceae bacterium B12219]